MRYWEKSRLWSDGLRTHPYLASSDSFKRPSKKIKGDYIHVILNRGKRQWAFTSMADRDVFVDKHGGKRIFTHEERAALDAPTY
jgi:hypothetical protein